MYFPEGLENTPLNRKIKNLPARFTGTFEVYNFLPVKFTSTYFG